MDSTSFKALHVLSSNNATHCQAAARCGCFYCLSIFPASQISEYWDEGQTAVCPHCGIDAVLPEIQDVTVSKQLLKQMQQLAWNGQVSSVKPHKPTVIEID